MKPASALVAVLALGLAAPACDSTTAPPVERTSVVGTVMDAQSNTQLFFYDEQLRQLDIFRIPVRQDGTFGPLEFTRGTFLGAGIASGATTGEFVRFTVGQSDTTVNFDLDPITIPLVVGNRWTYDEIIFAPAPDTLTVVVEITDQQPGEGVPAVFRVEERRTDPSTGAGPTEVFFLASDAAGIRKSVDTTIDVTDELLLRLPATLGTTWSTVDFTTGAQLQKRITGFSCGESGCTEVSDFTIAQEPAGIFMSVAELHEMPSRAFVTIFTDIGSVDAFVQDTDADTILSQRKLRSFQPGSTAGASAGLRP